MLAEGELDAVLHPDLIKPMVEKDPRVAGCSRTARTRRSAIYKKTGIFPIMHVIGIKQEIVERIPGCRSISITPSTRPKRIAMKRMENPRIVPLAWYREAWEEQEELLGTDPWEYGLTDANMQNSNALAGYSYEQGLIRRRSRSTTCS